jgi:hypothetical protein
MDPLLGRPSDIGLALAKGLVVFLRRRVGPGKPSDERSVRELLLSGPVGIDRDIVARTARRSSCATEIKCSTITCTIN